MRYAVSMGGRSFVVVLLVAGCAGAPRRAPSPSSGLTCGSDADVSTKTTPRGIETWCEAGGVRSGSFERRAPGGALLEQRSYAADVLDGPYASFYASGAAHLRGRYVRGQRDGAWRGWHENGKPWLEMSYASGEPTGTWLEYDDTGAKMFEGVYRAGRLEGDWRAYRGDEVAATGASVAGRLEGAVLSHPANGATIEAPYRDNRLHGRRTYTTKEGKVFTQDYVDGVAQGDDGR
jgi:uncharacterized protein